ncbi:MAG TPA: SDR family NAD(P)-dependent oxidoreductase [Acidimicrobiales bacterium]
MRERTHDQKSVVVTGAGSGVGRASALRFAEEGARVVCADVQLDWAKETVRQIEAAGGTAVPQLCDVTQEDDVVAAVAAAVDHFGRLDVMFNNVGIATPAGARQLEDHTVEDFDRLAAVNLRGVFLGCKHAIIRFKTQGDGGVILNTGSVAGMVGWGGAVYGATKGGVIQLTRAAAVEGAPFGIRVNAICPAGMPHTNFMSAVGIEATEDIVKGVAAMHPLGREITAEDCAEAALFLTSDRAANITGALLPVDGGYVAK